MDPDPNADPDQNLGQNTDLNPGDFLKLKIKNPGPSFLK